MLNTERLLDYISSVQYEDLPKHVIETAKNLIMNTYCAIMSGSGAEGIRQLADLIKGWGGKREAPIFLHGSTVPAHEAVFVNSTMARALDFDEFNLHTGIHTGATVVPVALAAAETFNSADGKNLISAIVVGAEVMSRMRLVPDFCIGVSGWSGEVFGAFGSTITAGRIMGLSKENMAHALGLAYSQASGNAQSIYDGVLATRLQQGFSARAGFLSAILATKGITGSHDFLEGSAGFYPVYYRGMGYDVKRAVDNIGEEYEFTNIVTKPYPCCGFLMAPIENVIDIMNKNTIKKENIREVVVRVNEQMFNTVCRPPEKKYKPQTPADAMFSLPYVIATAIQQGDVFLGDFSQKAIIDSDRLMLAEKVRIVIDEYIDKESKELNLALSLHELEIISVSGQHYAQKVYYVKGSPQKPMNMTDLSEKARKCSHYAIKNLSEDSVEEFKEGVMNLESQNDITSLTRLLL